MGKWRQNAPAQHWTLMEIEFQKFLKGQNMLNHTWNPFQLNTARQYYLKSFTSKVFEFWKSKWNPPTNYCLNRNTTQKRFLKSLATCVHYVSPALWLKWDFPSLIPALTQYYTIGCQCGSNHIWYGEQTQTVAFMNVTLFQKGCFRLLCTGIATLGSPTKSTYTWTNLNVKLQGTQTTISPFLATLVALHFTPVGKWVGKS